MDKQSNRFMENNQINPIENAWMKHPEARQQFIEMLISRYPSVLEFVYLKTKIERRWKDESNDTDGNTTSCD